LFCLKDAIHHVVICVTHAFGDFAKEEDYEIFCN
jgi:hypothetical protein